MDFFNSLLERVQEKWTPILRPDTRKDKHLVAAFTASDIYNRVGNND